MKKRVALILCIVMIFSLCACSMQGGPQSGLAQLLRMLGFKPGPGAPPPPPPPRPPYYRPFR